MVRRSDCIQKQERTTHWIALHDTLKLWYDSTISTKLEQRSLKTKKEAAVRTRSVVVLVCLLCMSALFLARDGEVSLNNLRITRLP